MGSEIDMNVNTGTAIMEVSRNALEASNSSRFPEAAWGKCESNREDDSFHRKISPAGPDRNVVEVRGNGDDEVDIVGDLDGGEDIVVEKELKDATEGSSSFGCTESGSGTADASGDMEVESQLRDFKATPMGIDRFTDIFGARKKKLTPHWRQFIRPLMWRCKWAELRIRELEDQASKYCKEIEECDKRKQFDLEKYATEDRASKSEPFVCQNVPGKVMRRKKRKKVEETLDLASYTSCHSLFSYFVSKRSGADITYMYDDNCRAGKPSVGSDGAVIDGEFFALKFKDSDAFESILRKIEEAQVHVQKLKARMDQVVRENTKRFSSDNSSIVPCDPSTSCGPKAILPHLNDQSAPLESVSVSCQPPSKKLALHETALSISGETSSLPVIPKTTDHPQIGVKCERIEKEIPMCNRLVKEELNDTEGQTQCIGESCSTGPDEKRRRDPHVSVTTPPTEVTMCPEQPTLKALSSSKLTSSKNKRKCGRRKARTGKWNRRLSG